MSSAVTEQRTGRKARPVRFSVDGRVLAVDTADGSLTVLIRSGNPVSLRGRTVQVRTGAGAGAGAGMVTTIVRNRSRARLGALQPGDRVLVSGVRTSTTVTAARVVARSTVPGPVPAAGPPPAAQNVP